MSLPIWPSTHEQPADLKLVYADTPVSQNPFPSPYQPVKTFEAWLDKNCSGSPIASCSESSYENNELDDWIRKVPHFQELALWSSQLLLSFREPQSQQVITAFDSSSSDTLWSLCMRKSSVELLFDKWKLPQDFLELIATIRGESIFSYQLDRDKGTNEFRLAYYLRTERELPADLALYVCWGNKVRAAKAFLHGCEDELASKITSYCKKVPDSLAHPLTMAVLIAEIQLDRHNLISRQYRMQYEALVRKIKERVTNQDLDTNTGPQAIEPAIPTDWIVEIFGMNSSFERIHRYFAVFRKNLEELEQLHDHLIDSQLIDIRIVGHSASISYRLRAIHRAYDDLTERARSLTEGTSLLLTTVYSIIARKDSLLSLQANEISRDIASTSTKIAKASNQDSSAMKALAVITMTFLPSTALAAIFAMPTFDWQSHSLWPIARRSIWIYLVFSVVLTTFVLYSWRYWYLGVEYKKARNEQAGQQSQPYRKLHHLMLKPHPP